MKINIKRAYDPPAHEDGQRFLVDRIWPRGVKREDLKISDWLKDAAPSTELRKWFNHDPERWEAFRERYEQELRDNPQAWQPIVEAARQGPVTLLYGAKDSQHNNALALQEFLRHQRV